MRLSLCIIGCGGYAKTVLNDIYDLTEDIELFFASRDRSKAREYCETYGGSGYFGSYEEAMSDSRVAAVYFFTPHHLHLDNALRAASHSKHILMEKPIARTIDESRTMMQAAKDAGIKLMVAENFRFLPTVAKARDILNQTSEASIGDLRLIQMQVEGYGEPAGWRANAEQTGGGVLIDGGIHFVDMLVNLGGFPDRVYAVKPPQVFRQVEGEDGIVMTFQMPGGAVGLINYSRATAIGSMRQWVHITGTRGQISFVPFGNSLTVEMGNVVRTVPLPEARRGVREMIKEFRDSVLEDREPAMSGEEGLRDLAVVLGAYQSAELGREVLLTPP